MMIRTMIRMQRKVVTIRYFSGDMSKTLVVFKGESSQVDGSSKTVQEAAVAEAETGFPEDQIDALKNLDDISDDDDGLEEGEIVSEEEAYWKEVDEVILPSISSRFVDEEIANKGINLDEVRAEADKFTDESGSTSQQQEINDPAVEIQEDWIRKLMETKAKPPKPTVYREKISSMKAAEYSKSACGRIISWCWDSQLKLFAIRRTDGVQYLRKSSEALNSLPHIEFKKLARLGLINPDHDGMADMLANKMFQDLRIKEDKDRRFHPQMGRKVKVPGKINPMTKNSWVVMEYDLIVCEPDVPIRKWKLDILTKLTLWYFDSKTYEAVMIDENYNEIIRVYEPLHLINLSKDDLLKLNRKEIWIPKGFEEPGIKYQNIVKLCVKRGLHADDKLSKT